jgi:hypothetical protein
MYQCDTEEDLCCPAWGAIWSGEQCSARTNNTCLPDSQCTVATDSCYEDFQKSAATGVLTCGPGCSSVSYSSDAGYYLPLPSSPGLLCYNASLWRTCQGAWDGEQCDSVMDASKSKLCAFEPACDVPAQSDFGCSDDADQCCVASSKPKFTPTQFTACGQAASFGSKKCSVQSQCVQVVDPCEGLLTPWDCAANSKCKLLPTGDASGLFGTRCISIQDPCPALSGATCEAQQVILGSSFVSRCRSVDRCKTQFCDATADACCANSGNYLKCNAAAGCTDDSICLPKIDDCKPLKAGACAAAAHCLWTSGTSTCSLVVASHSCYSIKDPFLCSTSSEQCLSVPLCVNDCKVCETCLAEVYAAVVQKVSSTTSGVEEFKAWCKANPRYSTQCGRVAELITTHPEIATRAGKICSLVGGCDSSSACAALKSPQTPSVSNSALQLCTPDGTSSTTPQVPTALVTAIPAHCRSDTDCTGDGQMCDLTTTVAFDRVCKDGINAQYAYGTCVDVCDTPVFKTALAGLNAQYKTCINTVSGSMTTNDCGQKGFTCMATQGCVAWTCAGGTLTSAACATDKLVCVATAPEITTATFANDKTSVVVPLPSVAAEGSFLCSTVFDPTNTTALGASARCSSSGKTLTISLRGDTRLAVGDKLALLAGNTKLVDAASGRAFVGSAVVASCGSSCKPPVASVVHPSKVVLPCTVGAGATTIVLDGSRSSDPSGRPFKTVAWALNPAMTTGESPAFATAFTAASNMANTNLKMRCAWHPAVWLLRSAALCACLSAGSGHVL